MRAFIERELAQVVHEQSNNIRNHILAKMKEPKSGNVYYRGNRVHVASAPGEFPAVDSGNLISKVRIRRFDRGLTAVIGPQDVPYASLLEGGTSRMKPRPFIKPTFEAHRALFISAMLHKLIQIKRMP